MPNHDSGPPSVANPPAQIRPATAADSAAIAAIYNHYITHTTITFEEAAIDAAQMHQRIHEVNATALPWLVAEIGGQVVGYCYASRWKGRCAYRFSVEITVYVQANLAARGVGTLLYQALFAELRRGPTHAVMAGIALPNAASVALHERFGLHKVAHFAQVGFKFEQWVDVGYWQLILK